MFQGQQWDIKLPSGRIWQVREMNGNDESILSNIGTASNGDSIYSYISGVIVGPTKPLAKEIMDWPLADKYYFLFKNRILNFGKELVFKISDPTDEKKRVEEYVEDLTQLDDETFKYPNGEDTHIERLFGDRKFRFRIMTGVMEATENLIPDDQKNINTKLLSRELSEWINGQWQLITAFHDYSARLTRDLRAWVDKFDPPFMPIVTIIHRHTRNPASFPLMTLGAFLFPEGTI